jgi:N-acetylglucosamine-6-phosphate deacetylase
MLDQHGRVSLPGTPYLAGSALTMDRAVANAVRFTGLPIHDVIPMATTIPAACLGAEPAGSIHADWDEKAGELHIRRVAA